MEITTSFKEKQKEDLTKLANKTLRVVTIYVSMQTSTKQVYFTRICYDHRPQINFCHSVKKTQTYTPHPTVIKKVCSTHMPMELGSVINFNRPTSNHSRLQNLHPRLFRCVYVCLCLTSHQQLRSYGDRM